jgi:hypothetical protein
MEEVVLSDAPGDRRVTYPSDRRSPFEGVYFEFQLRHAG